MRFVIAGGAALAVLVNFQETYAILFPTLGLATVRPWASPEDRRRSIERFVVFVFVGGLGLLFWAGFNNFRFGSFLFSGKVRTTPSPFGNPVVGLAGLLVSPGKSIFLYSPPTALALFGLRGLIARDTFSRTRRRGQLARVPGADVGALVLRRRLVLGATVFRRHSAAAGAGVSVHQLSAVLRNAS